MRSVAFASLAALTLLVVCAGAGPTPAPRRTVAGAERVAVGRGDRAGLGEAGSAVARDA